MPVVGKVMQFNYRAKILDALKYLFTGETVALTERTFCPFECNVNGCTTNTATTLVDGKAINATTGVQR